MPFATTALIAGGLAAAGSIGSSAMKAGAAGDAARVQAEAAKQAQELIAKQQQDALDYQNKMLASTTAAEQPYQKVGSTAANNLVNLLNNPFKAPTLAEAEQTPGFQFNLEQGTHALESGAAAKGNLFSGTQGAALQKYGQGLAETTYQQDYQNALQAYVANYNSLLGGTNVGLNSTGQLASANQAAAGNTANIDLTGASLQASQINNAAAARASGYVNAANAWGSGIQSLGNFASSIPGMAFPGSSGGGAGFTLPTSYGSGEYNPITGGYG